jgi:phospholipid/cholesterol/gamma-HCH transport system permease protein
MSGTPKTKPIGERVRAAVEEPAYVPAVDAVGRYMAFVLRGTLGIRKVGPYAAEVLRQTGLIATGSMLVIVWISFLAGATCGLEGSALARSVGAGIAGPLFSSFCTTREVVPFIFGFIVAAKVGGGIVAQLGAMRVNEEVDALEAMGVRSLAHLVSSRLLAAAIVLPFTYLLAIGSSYLAAYLMSAKRFGDVSQGTWSLFFYLFQDPTDLIYSVIKGMVISVFVIATAVFYGYSVRGGPTDVGVATARSMAVNIMAVTVISMAGTLVFWGANPRIPFG